MRIKNAWALIVAILISELAGVVGSVFTAPSIPTWYASLAKPQINPPAWLFGPVWISLYALMGVAAYLIWQKGTKRKDVKVALYLFAIQLVLNTLWSIIFFGFHNIGLALVELSALWMTVTVMLFYFENISRSAGWLIMPYVFWLSFAFYLNFSIWLKN